MTHKTGQLPQLPAQPTRLVSLHMLSSSLLGGGLFLAKPSLFPALTDSDHKAPAAPAAPAVVPWEPQWELGAMAGHQGVINVPVVELQKHHTCVSLKVLGVFIG